MELSKLTNKMREEIISLNNKSLLKRSRIGQAIKANTNRPTLRKTNRMRLIKVRTKWKKSL